MNLVKFLIVGAAAAAGINYITKKRADGTSIADDIKAKAPEWMEKAKPYMDKAKPYIDKFKQTVSTQTRSGEPETNMGSASNQPNMGASPM